MVTPRVRTAQIAFDALSIEGGLLAAEWLAKVARLDAGAQDEEDYAIPKGLTLRDEIGRYWRIAKAHWSDFESARRAQAPRAEIATQFVTSVLRDAFGFTSLAAAAPTAIGERVFPVGQFALDGRVPVVIAPHDSGLDAPAEELGDDSRQRSAFGLLQELLNASNDALWGIACDGDTLRIARDNASLTRPAWIQADLRHIFTEELYSDFAALWLLLHQSRFGSSASAPEACPLEIWRTAAREEGSQARDKLQAGFKEALRILGNGFVAHPDNTALRAALHDGSLSPVECFGELLRVVYRLIFLLAVEERGLLHPPKASKNARELYASGYAIRRLRDRAVRRSAHDRHVDEWESVQVVFRGLAEGESSLGLPALAGLFAPHQSAHLDAAKLENRTLLAALFHLGWLREPVGLVRVSWRDKLADELGYIYEGLLELVPKISRDGRTFSFAGDDESRGNARKTTGSYYTPEELVQVLIESALEPVIAQTLAAHPDRPAEALLELTVVDPACGSGHFLLAAARRMAEHVARAQAEGIPNTEDYRHALREVVRRCIYGVDKEPLAVELCKVSLWLEAIDPGMPLTFLETHIRHGNALLGTTRELMGDAVPDEAWIALEGDDRAVARSLKSRNRAERDGQRLLPLGRRLAGGELREALEELEAAPDLDSAALAAKERRWQEILTSGDYRHQKLVADAWCAAFFWPKREAGPVTEAAPTTGAWLALREGEEYLQPLLIETTEQLAQEFALFHWELAFPHVFARGGFDVVLGNPPWERVKLQEKEFFAGRDPSIANARNAAARKRLIAALPADNPVLWAKWSAASRIAQGVSHFARQSGRYPLCGKGDVNTYALFAEHNWCISAPSGRAGFIVPSGIATDSSTKEYFQALLKSHSLASIFHFENEKLVFKGLHHAYRFVLITLGEAQAADLVFFAQRTIDLEDKEKHFELAPADFETLNPNTRTCPTFRSRRDAKLNLEIYRRIGVFWREDDLDGNPWGGGFMAMFHMASDSGLFRTRAELAYAGWKLDGNRFTRDKQSMLPLYEAKMIHHFDHRFGSYEGQTEAQSNQGKLPELDDVAHQDPCRVPLPRYLVPESEIDARLETAWDRGWLLGWRGICRTTDQRTAVAAVIPRTAVAHSFFLALPSTDAKLSACLYANLCTLSLDYTVRQKLGGVNLTYYIFKQLPTLSPSEYTQQAAWSPDQDVRNWLLPRVLELAYTAWDLRPFAEDCGDDGPPFIWDPERRFQLRCEIDAAFFHLYGITRDDTGYILGTFPILQRTEEKSFGEYRTQRKILEIYDALAEAASSGTAYVSPLPPPRRAL